jgi:hypothetical protein
MAWWLVHCWRCGWEQLRCQPNDPCRWDCNGNNGRDPCPNCGSLWITSLPQPTIFEGTPLRDHAH